MLDGSHPARPARSVAEAQLSALGDGEALAKGWLLTLIAGAPLARAGVVPAAEMVREAPVLCDAAVAAIGSEPALARLSAGGDLAGLASRAGSMTGADGPAGVVAALAALRASLWHAVLEDLRDPGPDLVAALAARLARVCDTIAAAVFADAARADVLAAPAAVPAASAPVAAATEPAGESGGPYLAAVPPPATVPADVFPTATAAAPAAAQESWATVVVGRLARLLAERTSCAVLAVDIDDADRLLAADVRGEAAATLARAESAIREALRPSDAAVHEREGRVWVVAADTTLEAARVLAQRIVAAVGSAGDLHGAPLRASIGIATSPPDGDDAASLIAHADEGVFAARAAGVSLA